MPTPSPGSTSVDHLTPRSLSSWPGIGHTWPSLRFESRPRGRRSSVGLTKTLSQQVLVSHAAKIATGYPPDIRTQYVTAVQTLRLPYWDWASDPTLPPAVYAVKITVRAPEGIVDVPNPLASYHFQRPAVEAGFGGFLAKFTQTIRCLGEGGMLSNVTASNERMTAAAQDITGSVVCHLLPGATIGEEGRRTTYKLRVICAIGRRLTWDSTISSRGPNLPTAPARASPTLNSPTTSSTHWPSAMEPCQTSTGRPSTPCCTSLPLRSSAQRAPR